MLTVPQALAAILDRVRTKPPVRAPLTGCLGLVLAEDVASDTDSPPYDKSMMDGYAVIAGDLAGGGATLVLLEEVTAGQVPTQFVRRGHCTRIMTGAPIPGGADAVVMVERTELKPGSKTAGNKGFDRVHFPGTEAKPNDNILRAGATLQRGETVLYSGHALRPMEIGLLAEIGRADVLAYPAASVAVLATGDELVPPGKPIKTGQIRNSNSPMLTALVTRTGAKGVDLGIARDTPKDLAAKIEQGLEHDVLVLSGGVSAGVLDLVPATLKKLGVEEVFHKVHLKPGKPLWFGVKETPAGPKLVFGLPGNPVSSLVCFELFVRPALAELAGSPRGGMPVRHLPLLREHTQRGDRPTYFPAAIRGGPHAPTVEILHWLGSADLRALVDANCLAAFPAGTYTRAAGEKIEVYLL